MKGLRNRTQIADDDVDDSISPLGQINLHITDGVSSHEKTPDDELAEIDRALKLEALAAKRLELELQKEKITVPAKSYSCYAMLRFPKTQFLLVRKNLKTMMTRMAVSNLELLCLPGLQQLSRIAREIS